MTQMRSLVTGVAGFIGSHLAQCLLALGHDVLGVDCFTPYYDRHLKQRNVQALLCHPQFHFVAADLSSCPIDPLVNGVNYVFHQAAQAGVRASWGQSFAEYTRRNVLATQRLLEAVKDRDLSKFVYASSSSIYGNVALPMSEEMRPQPISPYGVSKLAAEHLCLLYHFNYGLPTVALRYFTVYGPRQRPDMGINRFIQAIAQEETLTIYGKGDQSRDFTYVDDIVRANLAAAFSPVVGEALNIGGGSRIVLADLLALIAQTIGLPARLQYQEDQKGDVGHTAADISQAQQHLKYQPRIDIETGIRRQVAWQLGTHERQAMVV